MLKIPYGESSFEKIIRKNCFYQDRTHYIRELEELNSSFLFYLRPRRFGKSLFITMLHSYYGLEHKERFNELFGHLAIGQNPTENANQYMVLSFEFSRINTKSEESTFKGFLSNVKSGVDKFIERYSFVFTNEMRINILAQTQPNEVIKMLFDYYDKSSYSKSLPKIYILIDEYDHFANELISFNYKYFATSVSQNGFVRKFYESIKTATRDSIVERLFVTGVSPITLDSLTSGFNISYNISLRANFHEMMGFNEEEVAQILTKIGVEEHELEKVLTDLRAWYDGYLFNIEAENHIYNPDMVLYFAMGYQEKKRYPKELLDPNIASDYSKIKNIFKIQDKETDNLEALKQLADVGYIEVPLTPQFSLEKDFTISDTVSLLFYMGFLTVQEENLDTYKFAFPNFVIKRLYAEYFVDMIRQSAELPMNNLSLHFALTDLGKYGKPAALYKEVEQVLIGLSNRDMQGFSENSLKAIFISLLHQQKFYYIHSEYGSMTSRSNRDETARTYVDIFLEGIKNYNVPFEIAFELKYAKISENVNIEGELDKAEIQLLNYLHSKKFNERPNVKAFVVLVHGLTIHSREIDIL